MLTSPHSSSFPIPPKKKKNLNSLWNLNIRCDPLDKTLVKKKCTSRKGEGKQGDVGRSVGKEGNSRSSAPPNDQHTRAWYTCICAYVYTRTGYVCTVIFHPRVGQARLDTSEKDRKGGSSAAQRASSPPPTLAEITPEAYVLVVVHGAPWYTRPRRPLVIYIIAQ